MGSSEAANRMFVILGSLKKLPEEFTDIPVIMISTTDPPEEKGPQNILVRKFGIIQSEFYAVGNQLKTASVINCSSVKIVKRNYYMAKFLILAKTNS